MDRIRPQLPRPAIAAPGGEQWIHEIKYDGYRMLAHVEESRVRMYTRGGHDWARYVPEVVEAVRETLEPGTVLDGEIVMLDEAGRPDFARLHAELRRRGRGPVVYQIWDMPRSGGRELVRVPLLERKAELQDLLPAAGPVLRYVDHIQGRGPEVFRQVERLGLEGVVSKKADSRYSPGRRPATWLKIKCAHAARPHFQWRRQRRRGHVPTPGG